ncbi:xanthine dehydrogenase family protein molybdopterin-binding subunit [Pseudomaricurvus alkylphenolicus]|uniref:xanthine dehydrogenase family protein molybdopterin-binding subunit n=1 Tax=Pseudomaricurvus alkylphenolicus TaxID=1306991 RepID=UPI0014236A16|nr:xanthine dehydrogenase family protein molybdopterin-binding subunit [Pseudomaricurvus alkylphenolicus]NIB40848.1 xanthine dehydrogenase family protein molybdopterin-binding subunit [Pseudomaricurvus alkylphenolicus]
MDNQRPSDRESIIGKSVPRSALRQLVHGRGRYTDDIQLPRMLELVFVRSPLAHAKIVNINIDDALRQPGIAHIFTGADIAEICKPWNGEAAHRPNLKSAPQYPLAMEQVTWQGEPIVAILAETRAQAEDAIDHVFIDFEELPAVVDPHGALEASAPLIHPDLGTNLADEQLIEAGSPDEAFNKALHVVEADFTFGRQTGVTLEPRSVIADYNSGSRSLTVYQSHQSPFQMQDLYAQNLAIDENNVRVICPDVGGAFGVKLHIYGDEVAAVASSVLTGRPVKFVADRMESFVSDTHARDHRVKARMAVSANGRIQAFEVDDLSAVGPYGHARRFSIVEGLQTITSAAAPYKFKHYRGRTRIVYQNKNMIGMYRGVGLPIACAVGEQMVDLAAAAVHMDPLEFRRQNYIDDDMYPHTTATGIHFEQLSLHQCLTQLKALMNYDELRQEQQQQRERGIYRGIGIATFIEQTAYGSRYYGPTEARVSVQEGCTLKLEPTGKVRCLTSATEQGQGTTAGIAQIVAEELGIGVDDISVIHGDSGTTPYGGGSWASRGAAMAGEAALKAARQLQSNILEVAAALLDLAPQELTLSRSRICLKHNGQSCMELEEVAKIGHFRQDQLPADLQPEFAVTRSHVPRNDVPPYYVANGVQASYLEVDTHTGIIRLLRHWAVDDCGRILNPMIVDEQVRGGIVQGIGGALLEKCHYDLQGQMLNASMADYLVPMASEMPDIHVEHVETPTRYTQLGAKGVGEAGTIGAIGVMWCAINDALRPLGAQVKEQPFTPEVILDALKQTHQ